MDGWKASSSHHHQGFFKIMSKERVKGFKNGRRAIKIVLLLQVGRVMYEDGRHALLFCPVPSGKNRPWRPPCPSQLLYQVGILLSAWRGKHGFVMFNTPYFLVCQ